MKHRIALLSAVVLSSGSFVHAQPKEAPRKIEVAPTSTPKPVVLPESPLATEPKRQAPASVAAGPSQVVAAFFEMLQKGDVNEAYASLTKGSKIAEKPEELRTLKAKTQEAIEAFGAIIGYDLVEAKTVGGRLVRSTYASHGKVFPLRWRFYFYKPDESWRLIDLRVDDKLAGIFDEPEEKPTEPK